MNESNQPIDIRIRANNADAAAKVLKIIGTAIETNESLDVREVKVESVSVRSVQAQPKS